MKGLRKVNADLVGFAQSRSPQTEATLDMDATLVETRKQEALPRQEVQGVPAADPYWSEAELIGIRSFGTATYLRATAVASVD